MSRILTRVVLLLCVFGITAFAQEKLRIMSYNLLKYPDNSNTRNEYIKTVIEAADPDILVCQEIKSLSGVNEILTDILNDKWSAGSFKDANGSDTDNAIFYKDSLVEFISHDTFPLQNTNDRNISEIRIKHNFTPDTLVIYSVHLKASTGSDNEARRLDGATRLRFLTNKLSDYSYFTVLGDFNIYRASEPAFQKLIDDTDRHYFVDPLDEVGTWHDNVNFRAIHTQSTRTTQLSDGGASGGLDDRFDMILVSQTLMDAGGITIEVDSYTPFGNDGKHFNNNINAQPNDAVSPEVAEALYRSSDHLPVFADFDFGPIVSVDDKYFTPTSMELYANYPNPFNPTTTISFSVPGSQFVQLTVYDILGREVENLYNGIAPTGKTHVTFNAGNLGSGLYFYTLQTASGSISKKMMVLK